MALEDDFSDIIKKARMGRGLSVGEAARAAGLSEETVQGFERGNRPNREQTAALARALGLNPDALVQIAVDGWEPAPLPATAVIETIRGDIGGYEVKGYVIADARTGEAAIVDTAYNPTRMLQTIEQRKLKLAAICLTHGHSDHATGLDRLLSHAPAAVYLGAEDVGMLGWHPPQDRLYLVRDGDRGPQLAIGDLRMEIVRTPGHTPGGLCFRLTGPAVDACFVGDTLFAGSIGRANPISLYPIQLQSVRQYLLTLPESTVLFPGHGPATTVREERTHNPFAMAA